MRQNYYTFVLQDYSSSLTYLEGMALFIIGSIVTSNLHPAPILLFFGIAHFITGIYYKIPMLIQHMKVIGEELIHGELISTGGIMS